MALVELESLSVLVLISARLSPSSVFFQSFKKRHWMIFILSFIGIWSGVFSALAGSYFQIISVLQATEVMMISGNIQDFYNLSNTIFLPFVDAAGVSAREVLIL